MTPTCPICAARRSQMLCRSFGHDVWRCPACCTDFVCPLPSPEQLAAFYDQASYYQSSEPGSYGEYDSDTESVLPLFRDLLAGLPGAGRPRSILDIGCAYGTHLAIAADQGWDAVGVEVSAHARDIANARHGHRFRVHASAEEVPAQAFDLITMFDVIEHLPQPEAVIDILFRRGLVGEQTIIALTTPNARSSHAVADPVNWPYRHPPAHLFYYSAESLTRLWTRLGAGRIEVRGVYEQERREPSIYPDEQSTLNPPTIDAAGLLCVASGFENAHQQIRKLQRALEEMALDLEQESARLQAATDELQALRRTKWFRLRQALTARPLRPRSLLQAAYLVAAMATPGSVRRFVRRHQWRPAVARRSSGAPAIPPYVVRQPAAPDAARPHVLHVIANFMTGGSSRLVVDLIEHLGQDVRQSVLTSFIPDPPAYVNLEITELPLSTDDKPFVRHLLRSKPDLVHLHYWGDVDEPWYALAIGAAQRLSIPLVENVNTPVQPYWSPAVQRYVHVSDYVRRVFGKPEPSHVTIYPGSDFSTFRFDADAAPAEDTVGMVYRLERDKLSEDAIQPFIAAARKRPRTRVLIVGGGELLAPFKAQVDAAGLSANFEFLGYVGYADLPAVYRRMSVFVAPVRKESFGQVSAFAMNMGIPVCGYDVGAIPEIVQDPSLLARPGDAEGLADVIVRLLDSAAERQQVGLRQHERAQAAFSVEAMIAAYQRLYRDLLPTVQAP